MSILEAVILGLAQGLTEFLPVSSSGHLALGEKLFGFGGEASVTFDVLVHLATLIAILIVVCPDIIRTFRSERRVLVLLVVGSVPAALVGFLIGPHMDRIKSNMLLVGLFFLGTAAILLIAHRGEKDRKDLREVSFLEVLFVGIAQSLAILPGISRSGSTISAARLLGIRPESAFSLSFLLGAIAITGASLLEARNLESLGGEVGVAALAAAFVVSLVSGLAALLVFRRLVVAGRLHWFAAYLVPLGIGTIIWHFAA